MPALFTVQMMEPPSTAERPDGQASNRRDAGCFLPIEPRIMAGDNTGRPGFSEILTSMNISATVIILRQLVCSGLGFNVSEPVGLRLRMICGRSIQT